PVPSFVGVLGEARMYQRRGLVSLSVRPDHIHVVDRAARDKLVLTTAGYTISRLEQMDRAVKGECTDTRILRAYRHYSVSSETLKELVRMTESAVMGVRPPLETAP